MKQILLAVCTLISFTYCSSTRNISTSTYKSDTLLAGQLQQIINEIPKGFESFKGKELAHEKGVRVYSSILTLHETSVNKIGDLGGRPCFMAKISEKKTEEEATELVKAWITKVRTCIGTAAPKQVPYRTGGTKSELLDGTNFFLGNSHSVQVYWSKEPDTEIYKVMIAVV